MAEEQDILDQLSAYLDGELTEAEAQRVEEAARGSGAVASELARLRAVRQKVRALPKVKAPQDLLDRILSQAERHSLVTPRPGEQTARPVRWFRYAAVAAAVLVAVGIGIVVKTTLDATRMGRNNANGVLTHEPETKEPAPAGRPHRTEIATKDDLRKDVSRKEKFTGGETRTGKPDAGGSVPTAAFNTGTAGSGKGGGKGSEGANWTDLNNTLAVNAQAQVVGGRTVNVTNVNIDALDEPGNRKALKKEVEAILARNDIVPLTTPTTGAAPGGQGQGQRDGANYYYMNVENGKVEIVALANRSQVPAIVKQLEAAQNSQYALAEQNVREQLAQAPAKDRDQLALADGRAKASPAPAKAEPALGGIAGDGRKETQTAKTTDKTVEGYASKTEAGDASKEEIAKRTLDLAAGEKVMARIGPKDIEKDKPDTRPSAEKAESRHIAAGLDAKPGPADEVIRSRLEDHANAAAKTNGDEHKTREILSGKISPAERKPPEQIVSAEKPAVPPAAPVVPGAPAGKPDGLKIARAEAASKKLFGLATQPATLPAQQPGLQFDQREIQEQLRRLQNGAQDVWAAQQRQGGLVDIEPLVITLNFLPLAQASELTARQRAASQPADATNLRRQAEQAAPAPTGKGANTQER